MCGKSLFSEFKHFMGQPVRIFTDDGRCITARVLNTFEDAVRVIDCCGCTMLIEFCHIDRVEEPQMSLCQCNRKHRGRKHEKCEDECDECEECEEECGCNKCERCED